VITEKKRSCVRLCGTSAPSIEIQDANFPKAMNRMAREMFSPLKWATVKRRWPLIDEL
jgi:hypothetical protein